MVINYSKWDNLELSDDSDIEVHPNVDKKSFIRAKQAQIHQERDQRRHQIKTLKYERIINDGLTERTSRLLSALKSHQSDQSGDEQPSTADASIFRAMMESMMDLEERPLPPPEGVHTHVKEKPTYPQMMGTMVDHVKKDVDEDKSDTPRVDKFVSKLEQERERVASLQQELLAKLAELEKEEKRHITSDDIRDGFNFSNVQREEQAAAAAAATGTSSSSSSKPSDTVELLNNPSQRPSATRTDTGDSGADADIEEGTAVDDDSVEASPTAKEFAKIKPGDWFACFQYMQSHPQLLHEKETDGLLVEAFNSELEGKPKHAKQCVHQGLLLQYCRNLGAAGPGGQARWHGVELFFKRIQTKGHQAAKMFADDVDATYRRIHTRAAEINRERAQNPAGTAEGDASAGVEQIQLHAVDPNTKINIVVPPRDSSAEDPQLRAAEQASRAIFDAFPPGLQRALESASLDEVNKVLAKMSVEEAEEIVEKLGDGGMLSLEEGVVDATTEEGKRVMEEIEKTGKMPGQEEES